MKDLITIVVPAYNVEKYLEQCLNSLINQTVMNHKVIVVDDGSTDHTGAIADKYAKQYPDLIRVVHQDNRGLGAARNVGKALVQTEYTAFLDSDDWLMPKFVERIDNHIHSRSNKPDIIYTLPVLFDMADFMYKEWMDKTVFDEIFDYEGKTVNVETNPSLGELEVSACRKVFKTSFLSNYSFPEKTKWEDVEPNYEMLWNANSITGVDNTGFIYRINSGKQITDSGGEDRLQVVTVFSRLITKALNDEVSSINLSYVMKMLLSFAKWSIDVSKPDVRIYLAKQLHFLYKTIPNTVLKRYYLEMKVPKRDKLLITLLKSPFYQIVGVSQFYEHYKYIFYRTKRIIKGD